MIKEFIGQNGFRYVLRSPAVVISKVKINNVDVSKFLSNQSKIGWYDISKDSGRDVTNADGTMVLNVIAEKYSIDLVTRPLTSDELIEFYQEIRKRPAPISVDFLNPFTGEWQNITCYRGNREAQAMLPYQTPDGLVEIYNPASISLIEM